jgi:hypothetical protein
MVPVMEDGSNKAPLVAVRDRREQIIEWLSDQFASDALEMEEYERRIDMAHQATSAAALDLVVADLGMPAAAPVETTALVPRKAELSMVARPEQKRMFAILGGVDRKGSWIVPQHLRVTTVMGGISLDFREAVLPPGITRVHVTAVMGGVDIVVPPHVAVQCDGSAILGGFEEVHRAPVTPDPETPTLMITGFAVMGGVQITTRLPGENSWQAWKRERRERKQLRPPERKQLGQ